MNIKYKPSKNNIKKSKKNKKQKKKAKKMKIKLLLEKENTSWFRMMRWFLIND